MGRTGESRTSGALMKSYNSPLASSLSPLVWLGPGAECEMACGGGMLGPPCPPHPTAGKCPAKSTRILIIDSWTVLLLFPNSDPYNSCPSFHLLGKMYHLRLMKAADNDKGPTRGNRQRVSINIERTSKMSCVLCNRKCCNYEGLLHLSTPLNCWQYDRGEKTLLLLTTKKVRPPPTPHNMPLLRRSNYVETYVTRKTKDKTIQMIKD